MPRKIVKAGLPSREQVLDFIQSSDEPAGKREIARAFGLKGNDKIALKTLLRDMADEGLINSAPGRAFHKMGGVPRVTVLRVADVDDGGRAWAVPEKWEAEGPPPRLRVMERRGRDSALGVGDRILARTEEGRDGLIAHPMKKLMKGSELVLGVVHQEGTAYWLRPVEKKERRELPIADLGEAQPGDLVLAEKTGRPPRLAARVDSILGDPFAPRSFSLIAIHKLGIPHEFPDGVIEEAERVAVLPLDPPRNGEGDRGAKRRGGGVGSASEGTPPPSASPYRGGLREDLTHIPIVAIDPADARDHDDAVWAAGDDDPANPGGWKAIVAIADVSYYVRPGSALDKEARKRGNSVYFPDRVVPMLPENLSADICSLKQGEDRAALVCHLQVTRSGQLKSWRFTRARVRIAANIAYEDAQAAIDGEDRVEVASSPCSMPDIPPVDPALVEIDAQAAMGVLAGALCGAGEARAARAGPSRAAGDARREGADPVGGAARAARRPQADRGLYDRRQRRRRQGAGGEEGAGHVPRPRAPRPREAGRLEGLSEDVRGRIRPRPGGAAGDVQPHHRTRAFDDAPRRRDPIKVLL